MDIRLFYRRKRQDLHVREIPSESEYSEVESNASEELDTEKDIQDGEDEEEDSGQEDYPSVENYTTQTPRWKTSHTTASSVHPQWTSIPQPPATRMFWSHSSRIAQVADVMPLARWEAIKKCLRFNDNSGQSTRDMPNYDELYKIRPLLDHILPKLKDLPMQETLCVDEQMVPFKGKNGIPHNLEVYVGKAVHPPELPDVGASGNVVLRLAEPIPKNKNFKVFFDNWFTSVPLMLVLAQQGIHCVGMVHLNRLPGSSMVKDEDLKRSGRGSFQEKKACVGVTELYAVKWYDNRSVTLLSTYVGAQPVSQVDRWDKRQKKIIKVPRPAIVSTYNQHMGGVDLLDSLIALYHTNIRSKKWYHRLVFHMIDLVVVTCGLIYRRDCADNGMTGSDHMRLYAFKSQIAHSLCKYQKDGRKRGRLSGGMSQQYEEKRKKQGPTAPIPNQDIRLDKTSHWPMMSEKKVDG
ncbi:piggyBac transposable element-derived protein 2-like [Scomber scombrus]|uniref:PiggyBac transposable element-derived protein 2-like n=1 Tax=Scomber scombrus TaxID=13677 RepID=A0AAV1PE52_SCOSC